jgi:TRAP-type C4-dicarboxylate transport system substrate-binding protein
MPLPDLFAVLATKTVAAQENPYVSIHAGEYNEVQKHLSAGKHAYAPLPVVVL